MTLHEVIYCSSGETILGEKQLTVMYWVKTTPVWGLGETTHYIVWVETTLVSLGLTICL